MSHPTLFTPLRVQLPSFTPIHSYPLLFAPLCVQLPSEETFGRLHSDSEYHHPDTEINVWFPLR